MSFKNKVVLVTGASSGIGASTAVLFAKKGADVVLVARNEDRLKKIELECSKFRNKTLIIKADLTNDDDVQKVVQETIAVFNKLDVLINNAGIGDMGCILDGRILEVYDNIMNINVRAVVRLTTLAAPYLVKTKGNIVNVSSIAGFRCPIDGLGAYSASKAALNQFSRATALELAPHNVRINILSPGITNTHSLPNSEFVKKGHLTALKNRILQPEEVADLIVYLASDKARGITGSEYVMDNGQLLLK